MAYIILLSTSTYSISYLKLLKKNGIININEFIKNILIQLFFITDIIGLFKIINEIGNEKSNVA
jgi:hypothetical protein